MPCYCYMVECNDGSLYTGWTLDPARRAEQHNCGKGATYTRLHRPVKLVFVEEQPDKIAALKREKALKKLRHDQKVALVSSNKNQISAIL